jgi:phospholipid N-methyltransferase
VAEGLAPAASTGPHNSVRHYIAGNSPKLLVPGIDFFRAFLKNWQEVGWPFQTSRSAARKICEAIDFDRARCVVEIGAGTGAVTRELLERLRPDAQLVVFEINSELCKHLRTIADSRLVVYNASGFELSRIWDGKADYVVSEVPIAMLSEASLRNFYDGIKRVLRDGGSCIQLQLSLLSYQKLKQLFSKVHVGVSLMNYVPVFIYQCRG